MPAQTGPNLGSSRLATRQSDPNWGYCHEPYRAGDSAIGAACGHGNMMCCYNTLPGNSSLDPRWPNGAAVICIHGTGSFWEICGAGSHCVPYSGSINNDGAVYGCQRDGLSAGAIAGIAVGSVAGAALIAGFAFFVYKRRRSGMKGAQQLKDEPAPSLEPEPEREQDAEVPVAGEVAPDK